jgi:hypothetical protein
MNGMLKRIICRMKEIKEFISNYRFALLLVDGGDTAHGRSARVGVLINP